MYAVFLTLFTTSALVSDCDTVYYKGGWQGVMRAILDTVVAIMAVYYFCKEAKQLYLERLAYFQNLWNWFDILGFSLVIVAIPFRTMCLDHEQVILSIAGVS